MILADRNISGNYNLSEREEVRGPFLDNCSDNYIKTQREKLLNGADIDGFHFQVYGDTIKDMPLLNILAGGYHLHVPVQNILYCTGHITGGHKKDANFFAEIFFDSMNELDPQKKLVDLYMFDGASVCRKALKTIEGFLSYTVMYYWSRSYLP